jgi:hypothetical protein
MPVNRSLNDGTEHAGAVEGKGRRGRPRSQPIAVVSGTYTIRETARRLGIGLSTAYDAIRLGLEPFGTDENPGPVPIRTVAGQKRTFKAELDRYLVGLAEGETG